MPTTEHDVDEVWTIDDEATMTMVEEIVAEVVAIAPLGLIVVGFDQEDQLFGVTNVTSPGLKDGDAAIAALTNMIDSGELATVMRLKRLRSEGVH